jgi:hypothetical protein
MCALRKAGSLVPVWALSATLVPNSPRQMGHCLAIMRKVMYTMLFVFLLTGSELKMWDHEAVLRYDAYPSSRVTEPFPQAKSGTRWDRETSSLHFYTFLRSAKKE